MANLIIGAGGVLGRNLKNYADEYLRDDEWIGITRENYEMWKGRPFNKVVWAAGMSSKIDCKPVVFDDRCYRENVVAVKQAVIDFPCAQFIYISSYDVYDPPYLGTPPKEDGPLMKDREWEREGYGLFKWMGEEEAKKANSYLCLRCNGFVGPGLKKNVIYDLSQENPTLYVSWDSRFQYIHTHTFSGVLFALSKEYRNDIFNVAPPDSIAVAEVANILGVDIKKVRMPTDKVAPRVHCVMDTSKLAGVLEDLHKPMPSCAGEIRYWMRKQ